MSYKDDEEFNTEVDINEEEVDLIDAEDDLDDSLLDDDLLVDDEESLFLGEDEEEMEEFAGLDGSEY